MREINLLPPSRRKALQRESLYVTLSEFMDSVIMGLATIVLVVIILGGILWFMALQSSKTTAGELTSAVNEYKELRQEVTKQNSYLSRITDLGSNRIIWTDFLRSVAGKIPPGVTISSIGGNIVEQPVTRPGTPPAIIATCSITGRAPNRDVLLSWQNIIQHLPNVGAVVSPVSNILERVNAAYKFDIQIKPVS